jgi:hypothetical protein
VIQMYMYNFDIKIGSKLYLKGLVYGSSKEIALRRISWHAMNHLPSKPKGKISVELDVPIKVNDEIDTSDFTKQVKIIYDRQKNGVTWSR